MSLPSIEDEFWEVLPYYMAIGMTPDEFWYGEPYLAEAYRKALKYKNDLFNQQAWWQGFYINVAVETALSNFHLDGKRHKHNDYIKEPIDLTGQKSHQQIELEQERERRKFQQSMMNWKKSWKEQYGQRKENNP